MTSSGTVALTPLLRSRILPLACVPPPARPGPSPAHLEALRHHGAGRLAEAERLYRQILARQPDDATALHNLGLIAMQTGHTPDALQLMARSLQLAPNAAGWWFNLGEVHRRMDDLPRAVEALGRAVAIKPDYGPAWDTLASVLREMGQYAEAMACIERAVAARPDLPIIHWNRAIALLLEGRLTEGWAEAESRFAYTPALRRDFPQPAWDGRSDLAGRTILLHAEQGLGDAIQFCRYAQMVAARGARVLLECQPELAPLLATAPGVSQVIRRGDPLPPFDLHCPLLSLPHRFGTTLETIPASVPYLTPEEQKVQTWKARLAGDGPGRKVGLAWAGSPGHANDRQRSCKLPDFAPLADVPNVTFFSLQKGPAAAQSTNPPPGMRLVDPTADLRDFADTAAVVANLDLVITVDTSVVAPGRWRWRDRCGCFSPSPPTGAGCATARTRRGTRRRGCSGRRSGGIGSR